MKYVIILILKIYLASQSRDFTNKFIKKTEPSLVAFYLSRATHVASIIPSYGLELLNIARKKQIPDSELTKLQSLLGQYNIIVYDVGIDITLEEYQRLSDQGKI